MVEKIIDLRSDTVTRPSPGMRKAMAEAEVGDDVYGEDPSVNRLQEMVAELLGKEASIFTASGTMANETAMRALTRPGDEVIVERTSHIYNYESGGAAALSGVQLAPIQGERGVITAEQIKSAIRPPDHHYAPTRLVCLENTHNRGGGKIYPLGEIVRIRELADEHGLMMHLDGARLLNAVVESEIPAQDWTQFFDSVILCLSKGLGAPVGSMVAGGVDFIEEVHRYRKMFGGGWRQAGILAAAGIYALKNNVKRLAEDHANAKLLAQGLAEIPGVILSPEEVETNIIIFAIETGYLSPRQIHQRLKARGVLINPIEALKMRAVTHLDVSQQNCLTALEVMREVMDGAKL